MQDFEIRFAAVPHSSAIFHVPFPVGGEKRNVGGKWSQLGFHVKSVIGGTAAPFSTLYSIYTVQSWIRPDRHARNMLDNVVCNGFIP